jgi:hypothetical protein
VCGRASPELKKAFRSFVLDPTRRAVETLPDIDIDASRLRLSSLITADHVTDVLGMADLERCAAYVERASCTAMALDVEKSPLSCHGSSSNLRSFRSPMAVARFFFIPTFSLLALKPPPSPTAYSPRYSAQAIGGFHWEAPVELLK